MTIEIISVSGVKKRYGTTSALNGLNLTVKKGEMYGLVGPDGAGKTTLMRILCGILTADEGTITLFGGEIKKEYAAIKKRIGYLSQHFSLYGDLTVEENIDFFAELHSVRDFKSHKEELLEFTRLTPFRDRLAGRLSGGMKKKLALACTLIHIPELILLDEPTTGVDPVSRRDFWKILSSLRKTGLTIIMTTPYLDEAERCSKIGLIYRGRIIAEGEPSAINESFPLQMVEYTCTPRDTALQIFKKSTLIKELSVHGGKIHAAYDDAERGITEAAEVLERNAVLWSSRRISPSLEDIFIYLIEQQTEQ